MGDGEAGAGLRVQNLEVVPNKGRDGGIAAGGPEAGAAVRVFGNG